MEFKNRGTNASFIISLDVNKLTSTKVHCMHKASVNTVCKFSGNCYILKYIENLDLNSILTLQ